MAKTYEQVLAMRDAVKEEYAERHDAHTRLRKYFHGKYWEMTEADTGSIASIFRDLTSRQSDIGPDIKLVYNILKDVTVKFQTYLAPLPMIRCYVDPPVTDNRRQQATLKERYLYGSWANANANKKLADVAWYLPLMGDCWHGIYPNFDTSTCDMIIRSPEYAYPLRNWDNNQEDAVIFSWTARQSAVQRAFPNYTPPIVKKSLLSPAKRLNEQVVEIMEYSDLNCFYRWVGGQQVAGVEHNLGFNLFEHVKFINIPDEVWGHGAVEQAVNLVEMGNAYLSLMMQSAIENVFPVMVIEDPMKAPENLERGAGAVIPVNAGGRVTYLTPPAGNLIAQSEWAREVERMVQTDTSMPEVNFGAAHQSIVTGKAINELQGAGTGTLVELVQGVGIGAALSSWNEKCIEIGRKMFRTDTIRLYGNVAGSIADINPRSFAMSIKGSQLVGSTRNEVVFMPYLDMQQKVVIGLQLAGAGLVSRKWQRDQVGIPDSEAMDEEIVGEAIQDSVMQLLMQTISDPDAGLAAEQQAVQVIEGGNNPHPLTQLPPPPPGLPPGGPPQGGGGGPAGGGLPIAGIPGGAGQVESPPVKLPPGAPVPQGGLAAGGTPPPTPASHGNQSTAVQLDQAVSAFQQLQGITGQIFLVGEIVATGQTSDAVGVDITSSTDRDTVASGVPFPVDLKVISGTPNEQYIEVTPGTNDTSVKGEEPSPEAVGA